MRWYHQMDMGSLIDSPGRRQGAWGLSTQLVERSRPSGRKAVVHLGDAATVCVLDGIPCVGDLIYGNVTAVIEKVCVRRDGVVRVHARRFETTDDPRVSGS